MSKVDTTSRKTSLSGDQEEMPIELRIICSVKPGDASTSPTCRITNVAVSPTNTAEEQDHDFDDEDFDESDSKIAEIHKLRRKESKGDSNRSVKRKHNDIDDGSEEDDDEEDDWDTEDLEGDDEDTVLSCVQRSMVKQGSTSLKKKR